MPQMNRLSSYRTTVSAGPTPGQTQVVYVSTPIVVFDHATITLRSGGYQTATTKQKMNQAACQFGLPYSVVQRNFDWFVATPQGEVPFTDGMSFAY